MRERRRDFYYRKAKEERYRSRATYKLLETVNKYGFMKVGDVVVDLGAAPGGWMQASLRIVGEDGYVLGVDLEAIELLDAPNARTVIGDVTDPMILHQIEELLPRQADVVISDVSPNISGVWELDHARQIDLAQRSLQIATRVLRVGGNFYVKVFQGDMLKDFVSLVKRHFGFVKLVKPRASRVESAELYVLGMNLRLASSEL